MERCEDCRSYFKATEEHRCFALEVDALAARLADQDAFRENIYACLKAFHDDIGAAYVAQKTEIRELKDKLADAEARQAESQ